MRFAYSGSKNVILNEVKDLPRPQAVILNSEL